MAGTRILAPAAVGGFPGGGVDAIVKVAAGAGAIGSTFEVWHTSRLTDEQGFSSAAHRSARSEVARQRIHPLLPGAWARSFSVWHPPDRLLTLH
jgi:hypothetical protein